MSKKNFLSRTMSLVTDPKHNIRKIYPYLGSKLSRTKRKIYELAGNEKLSKPYAGHDKLLKYLNGRNGFFVEVGGNDGFFQDPTYYLEKFRGWTGIIVEPLPVSRRCQRNRPNSLVVNVAVVGPDYPGKSIAFIDCNAMSVIKNGVPGYEDWIREGERCQRIKAEEIEVPAMKLSDILDEYFANHPTKQIDFLAIDVEGYELNVLKGLDLSRYQPVHLLIEILKPAKQGEFEEYLKDKYELTDIIGYDDYLYTLKTV